MALALGLGLFLVLRHSTRAPAWRQHEFYTSKAKILIKTNGPVVRLGYGRFDMDERDDPVLRRWFLDLSAVDKFIKRPEFLERVSALCDVPVSELSSVSAFPVVVVARHDVLY
ncbi:MAG: hypothetical protein KC910_32540, partial [Candidatus Eremiobacteraeota bacterium]|nr:hypothetical protein [Candidatus Eremiobacteraeota bacterium]